MLQTDVGLQTVLELDRVIDQTIPSDEQEVLGAWKLRFTAGFLPELNSVLPSCVGPKPAHENTGAALDPLIGMVERFYRQREQPAMFYLSPATCPRDLDAVLAARRYSVCRAGQVWTGWADEVQRAGAANRTVILDDVPSEAWVRSAFGDPVSATAIRRQLALRPKNRQAFASIRENERIVATALAIRSDDEAFNSASAENRRTKNVDGQASGGWVGLFCMTTRPEYRRQGLASALMRAIGAWSLSKGCRRMYLQVQVDNQAGVGLYRTRGFQLAYEYHYRRQPMGDESGFG